MNYLRNQRMRRNNKKVKLRGCKPIWKQLGMIIKRKMRWRWSQVRGRRGYGTGKAGRIIKVPSRLSWKGCKLVRLFIRQRMRKICRLGFIMVMWVNLMEKTYLVRSIAVIQINKVISRRMLPKMTQNYSIFNFQIKTKACNNLDLAAVHKKHQ